MSAERAGRKIGIDLGTTNCVTAIMKGSGPDILESREARSSVRSMVSLRRRRGGRDGGSEQILVGDSAAENWRFAPQDTIVSIKRLMGRSVDDQEVQRVREWFAYKVVAPSDGTRDSLRVVMGGKEYSPVEISALILGKLKEDAQYRLGEEVTHAVITVPAYFSQAQKAATRMAGLKAGLKVTKILDEPTAAAIAYGLDEPEDSAPKTILVYDLGGGTFDISVLLMAGSMFVTMDTEGDMWLGGDDFDQALLDHVVERIRDEYDVAPPTNDSGFMASLKQKVQKAKEQLSSMDWVDLRLFDEIRDEDGIPVPIELEISRQEYERLIMPLVARSLSLVDRAIEKANLTDEDIDHILMAGNATITPLVQRMVAAKFGEERVLRKKHPKHCVAEGAAIVAKLVNKIICPDCGHPNAESAEKCAECGTFLELKRFCAYCDEPNDAAAETCVACGKSLLDVAVDQNSTRHYGVQAAGDEFEVFVEKNDPVPTTEPAWKTFRTQVPNQWMISIPVYGGDALERASANEKQGEAFASLPPGLPQGAAVRLSLWLDEDEVFMLAARLEDGTELKPWVTTGEEDAQLIEVLGHIEREFTQLVGALGSGERKQIETLREQVLEQLASGNTEAAREIISSLQKAIKDLQRGGGDDASLEQKAKGLIGFTEFVLSEYGWAVEAEQAYSLRQLVQETKDALSRGDQSDLQQRFQALDEATDKLPQIIQALLSIRGAIVARIEPVKPELAQELMAKLGDTQEAFQENALVGMLKLDGVAGEVTQAIKDIEREQQVPCPGCGELLPPGERICPHCGHDTWTLVARREHTSGVISR